MTTYTECWGWKEPPLYLRGIPRLCAVGGPSSCPGRTSGLGEPAHGGTSVTSCWSSGPRPAQICGGGRGESAGAGEMAEARHRGRAPSPQTLTALAPRSDAVTSPSWDLVGGGGDCARPMGSQHGTGAATAAERQGAWSERSPGCKPKPFPRSGSRPPRSGSDGRRRIRCWEVFPLLSARLNPIG